MLRDYSRDHLERHKSQEVRRIIFSVDASHEYKREDLGERNYYFPFKLSFEIKREGESLTLDGEGFCDSGYFLAGFSESQCFLLDEDGRYGSFSLKNAAEDPDAFQRQGFRYYLTLNDENRFNIRGTKQYTHLIPYDFKSLVKDDWSLASPVDGGEKFAFSKGCPEPFFQSHQTMPRMINETALALVRLSLARPTVTARNLYHLSAMLWDIQMAFKSQQDRALFVRMTPDIRLSEVNMLNTMAYAAYEFLKQRYKNEPGNEVPIDLDTGEPELEKSDIALVLEWFLKLVNLDHDRYPKSRALAKRFADQSLAHHLDDGSREVSNYDPEADLRLVNENPAMHINLSGIMSPPAQKVDESNFPYSDWFEGAEFFSSKLNINHWNPLYVPGSLDQNGNDLDYTQSPLTLHWGRLPTFSDLSDHYDEDEKIYFNPSGSLLTLEKDGERFIRENLKVAEASLWHNPIANGRYDVSWGTEPDWVVIEDDNKGANLIDISPVHWGNHSLGSNDGQGYGRQVRDNATGRTYNYQPYFVKAADFYRSIAEFWADGPKSETPPGHWNTLANYTMDQMILHEIPFKWQGKGEVLDRVSYETKLYLTLNGALHDAAVVAWGIKGAFQGGRPITVIRKFAAMAEEDRDFAERLVEIGDGLLKFERTDYRIQLTSVEDLNSCNETILKPDQPVFMNGGLKTISNLIKKGVEVNFQIEVGDSSAICYAVFSQDKLWIKSWLGHSTYDTADESRKLLPVLSPQELKRREVFARNAIGGTGWMPAENWTTYQKTSFVTPPFPGFVSGHSTFSRAAAEVLAAVTGSKFFPGGLGTYRAPQLEFEGNQNAKPFDFQWATYFDASDQSGVSRVYGGIHASYDDLPARKIGSKIGQAAVAKANDL